MISIFFSFFIQSPSISPNKTVVIKTMISDKTVFHFQHCDHQLTLVIVVQLPRLPVDVFCFIETWSNVCFRQASLFSVLSKLRQVHTYYVFFSKQQFHLLQCFFKVFFLYVVVVMSQLVSVLCFFWNLPSLRTMISLTFSMTCSFVPSVYYCRCFKQTNKIKKKTNKNNMPVDSDLYVVGGLSNQQENTFLIAKHLRYLECSEWFVATHRPNA